MHMVLPLHYTSLQHRLYGHFTEEAEVVFIQPQFPVLIY